MARFCGVPAQAKNCRSFPAGSVAMPTALLGYAGSRSQVSRWLGSRQRPSPGGHAHGLKHVIIFFPITPAASSSSSSSCHHLQGLPCTPRCFVPHSPSDTGQGWWGLQVQEEKTLGGTPQELKAAQSSCSSMESVRKEPAHQSGLV